MCKSDDRLNYYSDLLLPRDTAPSFRHLAEALPADLLGSRIPVTSLSAVRAALVSLSPLPRPHARPPLRACTLLSPVGGFPSPDPSPGSLPGTFHDLA